MREKSRKYFQDRHGFLGKGVSFSCGDGWFGIVQELLDDFQALISRKNDTQFRVEDIYQKYGSIRVDHTGDDDYEKLVLEAEARSEHACEVCASGQGMERDEGGWVTVLCDDCSASVSGAVNNPQ